jgi:hypothetical protein
LDTAGRCLVSFLATEQSEEDPVVERGAVLLGDDLALLE